jgi:hypothetical protein
MSLVAHPISQPSLDISPILTPVTAAEVRNPFNVEFVKSWVLYLY